MKESKMQTKPQVLQELQENICHLDYTCEIMYDKYDKCYFLRISDDTDEYPVIDYTLIQHVVKSGLQFFISGGELKVYPRPMFL